MQKPIVSILSGIYPPDSGGPATFAVAFSDFARSAGYQTKVISLTNGSSIVEESANQYLKLVSRRLGLLLRTGAVVGNIAKLFSQNSRVIANGLFIETYLASLLTRKPYTVKVPGDIVWERAINSGVTQLEVRDFQSSTLNLKYRFFRLLFTRSILRANMVLVPSPLLYELCLTWGAAQDKIRMIYNSVDVDFYSPSSLAEKIYDCIVVNRLVAWKNVEEIILACDVLNLSLLIVGDGPEMSNLVKVANKSRNRVAFTGNVSKNDLLGYLQSAKIYILNSTADATAYSLLEARSCGLIAVANIKTGASEVIEHQVDGYLTESTSQSELESVISSLLSRSTSELQKMSQAARLATVQSFNKNKNFSKILELVVN